ncbi:MAG: hypothetical protein K0Q74_1478 [Gammaproteobacteria bacterium]|jgi:hypothetical protein|nr:hypothetical protein [Gammaproteobacteria bacterium]
MLLQAKKSNNPLSLSKPDNSNQHHLYAHWPEFEYIRSNRQLNGEKGHVKGSCYHDGAKYLLIGLSGRGINSDHHDTHEYINNFCPAFTAQATMPKLSGYRCFIDELYEFFLGKAGRPFIYKPNNCIDWDQ